MWQCGLPEPTIADSLQRMKSEMHSTDREPFAPVGGELHVEEVSLADLYRAIGPCYVYSRRAVERRVMALERAFAVRAKLIAYAVKANPNHARLEYLCAQG